MAAGLLDLRQFLQPLAHILTPARSIGIASWTVRTVHSQQGQQATDPTPRVQFPPRMFLGSRVSRLRRMTRPDFRRVSPLGSIDGKWSVPCASIAKYLQYLSIFTATHCLV